MVEKRLGNSEHRRADSAFLRTNYPVSKLLENPRVNNPAQLYQILLLEEIRDILLRERSHTTDWSAVGFAAYGAAMMAALVYMRRAFYWWPISTAYTATRRPCMSRISTRTASSGLSQTTATTVFFRGFAAQATTVLSFA